MLYMDLTIVINFSIKLPFNLEIRGALNFMYNILFAILGQVDIRGDRALTNI